MGARAAWRELLVLAMFSDTSLATMLILQALNRPRLNTWATSSRNKTRLRKDIYYCVTVGSVLLI
jgi:hypothetical protein